MVDGQKNNQRMIVPHHLHNADHHIQPNNADESRISYGPNNARESPNHRRSHSPLRTPLHHCSPIQPPPHCHQPSRSPTRQQPPMRSPSHHINVSRSPTHHHGHPPISPSHHHHVPRIPSYIDENFDRMKKSCDRIARVLGLERPVLDRHVPVQVEVPSPRRGRS